MAEDSEAPGSNLTAGIGLITVINETGKKRLIISRRVNNKVRSVAMADMGGEQGRFGVIGCTRVSGIARHGGGPIYSLLCSVGHWIHQ